MKWLSRTEEMILLSVASLGEKAYGLAIRDQLNKLGRKRFSVGAVYVPLERLSDRGLLITREGDPTPERGGRSKRYYELSQKGEEALEEIRALNKILWSGYSSPKSNEASNPASNLVVGAI
jgi:DNA-binding PadR family transcriptional regulator